MNKDKKYYVFVYDHEIEGPLPIFIDGTSERYDGYYTYDEFLNVESKIFYQMKDDNPYYDCDFYLTVTQWDNEEDAQSFIAYKENWHKTYSTTKIIDK